MDVVVDGLAVPGGDGFGRVVLVSDAEAPEVVGKFSDGVLGAGGGDVDA